MNSIARKRPTKTLSSLLALESHFAKQALGKRSIGARPDSWRAQPFRPTAGSVLVNADFGIKLRRGGLQAPSRLSAGSSELLPSLGDERDHRDLDP